MFKLRIHKTILSLRTKWKKLDNAAVGQNRFISPIMSILS